MSIRMLIPFVLFVAYPTAESYGHNVQIFAGMEGTEISGYVYSSDGRRLRNVTIEVFNSDGTLISKERTSEDGEFRVTTDQKQDLTLVAETEDGHRAEWRARAEEIPEFLPVESGGETHSDGSVPAGRKKEVQELRMIIREELKPLQAQLSRRDEEFERFRDEIRWRDVVGGIGYFLGIAGVACFLQARKKERQG